MTKRTEFKKMAVIGWRELVSLTALGVDHIKVKVDSGARTSALHASRIQYHPQKDGSVDVSFRVVAAVSPRRTILARAKLIAKRRVKSSSGQATLRPVIEVTVRLGEHTWPVEVTLVNRDPMGFRMLLGRRALSGRFLVHPGRSFLQSSESGE